ncbi:MAG: ferrochelatase [candidate division KSB1 bacterium]|nr:ferrochelatase [candidate division KSB1 bacterium]
METKRGILLVNLGSPNSPTEADLREYLDEFLMDERVLDIPYWLRKLIVRGIVLPIRSKKSAHAYEQIWWPEGSPLLVLSERLQQAIQTRVDMPVEIGMRYGEPSIRRGILRLLERSDGRLDELRLVPLYPHYAMATFETVVVEARRVLADLGHPIRLTVLPPFYDHPDYIEALYDSIRPYLQSPFDYVLFSYHGVPERHLRKSDPTGQHCLRRLDCCQNASPAHRTCYRYQVMRTTEALAQKAGLPEGKYGLSFQSRFGPDTWLQPFTDEEIVRLAKSGVRNLTVLCPAFVADCLETLEEIGIRGREAFLENGGEAFTLIPCLNVNPRWIEVLAGWLQDDTRFNSNNGSVEEPAMSMGEVI